MEKRYGVLILVFVLVGFAFIAVYDNFWSITGDALADGDTSTISRSFSGNDANEDIVVTLDVSIDSGFGHKIYLIEETVPAGLTIVDEGSATVSGSILRWTGINKNGIDSVSLSYTINSPSAASYSFVGEYVIDGMDDEGVISNSILNVLEVSTPDEEAPTFNYNVSRPITYSSSSLTHIDFNWNDNVAVSHSYIEADFGGSFVNYSGSDWIGVLGAGSYNVRGWAIDSSSNWGASPIYPFDISKSNPDLTLILNGESSDANIGLGGSVNIVVNADKDYILYQDGVEISPGLRVYHSSGSYNLSAYVLEDANYTSYFMTRFITVSGFPHLTNIHWNHSRWLSGTTNFSSINSTNFLGKFINRFGEISFLNNLSILRNLDLSSNVYIRDNSISINSSSLPEFNHSAELRFNGLTFTDPRVLKNGEVCSSCVKKGYSYGILVVEVSSFSDYTAEEGYVAPDAESGAGSESGPMDATTSIKPVENECVENYACGSWSSCIDGLKGRSCVDNGGCNVDKIEERSCEAEEVPFNWMSTLKWVLLLLLVFVVVFMGWVAIRIGGLGLRRLGR